MRLIYITTRNAQEAKRISIYLLEKKLAACINMFPIESMYYENGEIQENTEFVVLIKTKDTNFKKIEEEIIKLHSYETPAIFSWKTDKINKKYDNWINGQLKK